jgi:hypothetical protein
VCGLYSRVSERGAVASTCERGNVSTVPIQDGYLSPISRTICSTRSLLQLLLLLLLCSSRSTVGAEHLVGPLMCVCVCVCCIVRITLVQERHELFVGRHSPATMACDNFTAQITWHATMTSYPISGTTSYVMCRNLERQCTPKSKPFRFCYLLIQKKHAKGKKDNIAYCAELL